MHWNKVLYEYYMWEEGCLEENFLMPGCGFLFFLFRVCVCACVLPDC